MKIANNQFGEIEFEKESIINFEEGILGFEEYKRFILLSEKDGFFFWLTCVDEPEIVFPLFSINLLEENFKNDSELEPFGIVKLDKDPHNVTINLKAPVFINHDEKHGYQKIMDNDEYPVDYPLFTSGEKI